MSDDVKTRYLVKTTFTGTAIYDVDRMAADLVAAEAESQTLHALIVRQSDLLAGVVNAIRGEPAPLSRHSHHDAVELVQTLVTRVRALERIAEDETAAQNKK